MSEDPAFYKTASPAPAEEQLSLFAPFRADVIDGESHTFDLVRITRFVLAHKRIATDITPLNFTNRIAGTDVTVSLTPAIVTRAGKGVAIFPSEAEELVERALHKMLSDRNFGEDQRLGLLVDSDNKRHGHMIFTLHELRMELAATNHHFTVAQLKESLNVLEGSLVQLEIPSGLPLADVLSPRIRAIHNLSFAYKRNDSDGTKTYVSLTLDACLLRSITNLDYKPINYRKLMALESPLARWLNARMSHTYRQAHKSDASRGAGYNITLGTILAESGVTIRARWRENVTMVKDALQQLLEQNILNKTNPWSEENVYESGAKGRPSVIDVKFILHPSTAFVEEIIEGNSRMKRRRDQANFESKTEATSG